ncbi:RES family NAD+ phosphorylase [Dyadobacter sp. Leaf189]|uniref:RES family NAD+ phosphorylase n=1 Tax=Dyadobacter sp. Leaf189 TaxID=1736295 RepID=UPI00138F3B87|nr:RES family NAD+ phosphorylase [Dyadobacter sp. Leaf189]
MSSKNASEDDMICHKCIENHDLAYRVLGEGEKNTCFYCGRRESAIKMSKLSAIIEHVFERHFELVSNTPDRYQEATQNDPDRDYIFEPDGDSFTVLVEEIAGVNSQIACDIQEILSQQYSYLSEADDTSLNEDCYYKEKSSHEHEWDLDLILVQHAIETQGRHFNSRAADFLNRIFEGLSEHQTKHGKPIIVEAGPESLISSLFRARVFKTGKLLEEAMANPEKNLGPPPSEIATAGRMNPFGISVFYGSNDPIVARAEVRPPIGSMVAIASFRILRPLKLLDLEALADVYVKESYFHPDFEEKKWRAYCIRHLSQAMSVGVMPGDENREYILTQAMADYLAYYDGYRIDGIIYPSIQAAKLKQNIVLFHKASRVQKFNRTINRIEARLQNPEDGSPDFVINEFKNSDQENFEMSNVYSKHLVQNDIFENRLVTLSLDLDSIVAEQVVEISYKVTQSQGSYYPLFDLRQPK